MHDIRVTFPGGKRLQAELGAHTVFTDQPEKSGGEDTAPTPSDLFFTSLVTCAAYYVLAFCAKREIPTEEMALTATLTTDKKTHMVTAVRYELTLPPAFPEKYRGAIVRSMEGCYVKKHLETPPSFETVLA